MEKEKLINALIDQVKYALDDYHYEDAITLLTAIVELEKRK